MKFNIYAACGCNVGKIRKSNEDNFCFDNRHLEIQNNGISELLRFDSKIKNGICFAVFDGMGGENFGEYASFAAADRLLKSKTETPRINSLGKLIEELNAAVVDEQRKLLTTKMGTTMASIHFSQSGVFVCNVGDSRVYRFRRGNLLQLSVDHNERHLNCLSSKSGLTQYLGLDPEEVLLDPHILKRNIESGDIYLLCSDGLTDMVSDYDIHSILSDDSDICQKTEKLINSAISNGGKDNITVILCCIK